MDKHAWAHNRIRKLAKLLRQQKLLKQAGYMPYALGGGLGAAAGGGLGALIGGKKHRGLGAGIGAGAGAGLGLLGAYLSQNAFGNVDNGLVPPLANPPASKPAPDSPKNPSTTPAAQNMSTPEGRTTPKEEEQDLSSPLKPLKDSVEGRKVIRMVNDFFDTKLWPGSEDIANEYKHTRRPSAIQVDMDDAEKAFRERHGLSSSDNITMNPEWIKVVRPLEQEMEHAKQVEERYASSGLGGEIPGATTPSWSSVDEQPLWRRRGYIKGRFGDDVWNMLPEAERKKLDAAADKYFDSVYANKKNIDEFQRMLWHTQSGYPTSIQNEAREAFRSGEYPVMLGWDEMTPQQKYDWAGTVDPPGYYGGKYYPGHSMYTREQLLKDRGY